MSLLLEALACIAGVALVVLAITSALRVLVVPRSSRDRVARTVFGSMRRLFEFWAMRYSTYAETDRLSTTGLLPPVAALSMAFV